MKVRQLPKANKSVKEKLLKHHEVTQFLKKAGFNFESNAEQIILDKYNENELKFVMDQILSHVEQ